MTIGDHILWHVPQPHGDAVIKVGQVKHINDYGAIVNQWVKDSKGVRRCQPEFYPWSDLKRCQVMGNSAVCD